VKPFSEDHVNWVPYQMNDVVDVSDARLSVRNYMEQKDLRTYLCTIDNANKIELAVEFGCGYGRMTQVLTEFAGEVVGLERENLFVSEATVLIPKATFIQTDDLSFSILKAGSYDVVVSFTFLQHIIDTEAAKVGKEMIRLLSPKGRILICEETDESATVGNINDPLAQCMIGRKVERYCEIFRPLRLDFTAPRRIEPTDLRSTGTYMVFSLSQ